MTDPRRYPDRPEISDQPVSDFNDSSRAGVRQQPDRMARWIVPALLLAGIVILALIVLWLT